MQSIGNVFNNNSATDYVYTLPARNGTVALLEQFAGMIVMWSGSIASIPSGWVLCNGLNSTPDLRDRFIVGAGTTYAVAATGGATSTNFTPTGTNSAPTMSGSTATEATHTHGVTSNVAVADHAAHTHSVTSNAAVADHAAHTHSVTATGTNSAPAFTGNAVTAASTTAGTKLVTGNTSTGVSPVTTATGSVAAPVFTGSAATSGNPSATLTHTVTNNAVTSGNPSATLTHSVTNNAVTSAAGSAHSHTAGTLAASAPTFTGTQGSVAVLPPYYALAYIMKS